MREEDEDGRDWDGLQENDPLQTTSKQIRAKNSLWGCIKWYSVVPSMLN